MQYTDLYKTTNVFDRYVAVKIQGLSARRRNENNKKIHANNIAAIVFIIIRKIMFGDPVSGWPSLVCIILWVSGIQLFCLGILGQYLAKTYLEVKRRPVYLVKEEL